MARLIVVLSILMLLAAGCGGVAGTNAASPSASAGISQTTAIALAREHTSSTTLISATVGRIGDLNLQAGYIPANADQIVWAVTFTGEATICGPPGPSAVPVCVSPRPSTTAVYLDYVTGAFVSAETNAPAP
jgi:hypothetical protein